ncbi:MAG: hypothetical protein ACLQBB_11430 [Solirubrobacteraceae bacterium]
MGLALGTAGVVLVVLLWELARPTAMRTLARAREAWSGRDRGRSSARYDPGRERRAEQRARELLRSCVSEQEWAMYRDLGLMRVLGPARPRGPVSSTSDGEPGPAPYAYLIYPHKPIVAYVPETGELLSEYCVAFPDQSRPYGSVRLPDSDDVLAKWMALTGDERRLIGEANMHLPGRQVDPDKVRRDLERIGRWERQHSGAAVSVPPHRRPVDNLPAA